MGIQFVGFVTLVVLALAATAYGLFSSKRSLGIALIAFVFTAFAVGGAWYAWAESQSALWTFGYITVASVSFTSGIRQFTGRSLIK